MNANTLTLFSARDAKTKFGEVLDAALGRPVGITKHDRLTVYIVSKFEFESMQEQIAMLEDQLWLLKADAARNEGFASANQVSTFLANLKDEDGSKDDKTGTQIRRKPR